MVERLVDSGIVSVTASDSRCAIEARLRLALRRSQRSGDLRFTGSGKDG